MRLTRSLLWATVIVVVFTQTTHAGSLEGTNDSYLLGDRPALTGGACVAMHGGPESAWYNPAGLGAIAGSSVSVSASAFMLRSRAVPDLLVHEVSSGARQGVDLVSTEFLSVPSTMVAVWKVSEAIALTAGYFVPRSDYMYSDHTLSLYSGDASSGYSEFHDQLSESFRWDQTHLSAAVGWQAAEWMRLGLALNLVLDERTVSYTMIWQAQYASPDEALDPMVASGTHIDQLALRNFALQATLGLQLELGHDLHLGVSFQSPLMGIHADFEGTLLESMVGADEAERWADFGTQRLSERGFDPAWLSPVRVRVGVAYELNGGWIALDGDVSIPVSGEEEGMQSEVAWNLKAGALIPITDTFRVGLGLFTDHSAASTPTGLHDSRVDFYGVTTGVDFDTAFTLKKKDKGEGGGDTLKMSHTIAVRYAAGVGAYGTEWHDPEEIAWKFIARDVVFHEFSLHLGSGLSF